MTRVLGAISSSWAIEQSMRDLLYADRGLIGVVLDEINRQAVPPGDHIVRVERPRSVKVRWSVSRFAEDQLPAIVIQNAGTTGDVYRDGEGRYTATWDMLVAGIAQATDEDIARSVASDLSKAAAVVIVEMLPKVDSRVVGVQWDGESEPVDLTDDIRSRCGFGQRILVTVSDHLCDLSGLPADWDEADPPIGQPPLDTGDIETVLTAVVESAVPTDEPV